jgi:predicted ribosome-associated RNA-binding protein Tma20
VKTEVIVNAGVVVDSGAIHRTIRPAPVLAPHG